MGLLVLGLGGGGVKAFFQKKCWVYGNLGYGAGSWVGKGLYCDL